MKFKFKETKIYKALFYKTDVPRDKIRNEWLMFPPRTLPTPGSYRRYAEVKWGITILAGSIGMMLGSALAWHIPLLDAIPPLNTLFNGQELHIDGSIETHVALWLQVLVNTFTGPLHMNLTPEQFAEQYPSVAAYKFYMALMAKAGLTHLVYIRASIVAAATGLLGWIGYCNSARHLISTEFIIESEGAKIFEAEQAERELNKFWLPNYSTFSEDCNRFANIGVNVFHPEDLRRQHTFIVGNSGSGKSQILQEFIFESINKGLKTVILDPKSEWTKNLFDENDPSIALIDPTDARSHVWSFMEDLKGNGFITSFVASVIPSGNSKDPMWTNAARMVNVALFLFLKKVFGDKATFKDVADVVQLSDEQIGYIVNKYYPHAARLVGELTDEGLEQNQTVSGIMINMISFMEYFMDLARYWNKPTDKTISLYKFMTDPNYPIKTIIIRPNETESRMARGITANVLAYLMNFIKKPELYGSAEKPVGNFILDEFQSPGKLEDENNDPVLQTVIQQARSFGWGCYFATQTIPEAERIYGKEVIAGWRGTIGTQILAGAPLDQNIQPWIDGFGDKKIQKYHLSQSIASNGDVSYSGNWQEHISKVMVSTTLTAKLRNETPWIKYLIVPIGTENLFFLRKTFKKIYAKFPSFVRANEGDATLQENSRVLLAAKAVAKGKDPLLELAKPQDNTAKKGSVYDRFNAQALDQEYADMDDAPDFNADNEYVETETTLGRKFQKEYDITPTNDDEDSLEGDVAKDKITEILLDSHAINAIRQLWEIFSQPSNKRVKTTNKYEKIAFDNKQRYKQSYTGIELKREKEKE